MNELFRSWLASQIDGEYTVETLTGDASFRSFFLVKTDARSFIAMHSPPEKEDNRAFEVVASVLLEAGLPVPKIYHKDTHHGLFLMDHLGTAHLSDFANDTALYESALTLLSNMQQVVFTGNYQPPCFDERFIQIEIQRTEEWFYEKLLAWQPTAKARAILADAYALMCANAQAQPQVFIHRDYHARNLMVSPAKKLGIIDFQDAMTGPITYDAVSLLKDAYVTLEDTAREGYLRFFYQHCCEKRLIDVDYATFHRWFVLMGLQRHYKLPGIFSRLYLRDGHTRYLNNIPQAFAYMNDLMGIDTKLDRFVNLLRQEIVPRWEARHIQSQAVV